MKKSRFDLKGNQINKFIFIILIFFFSFNPLKTNANFNGNIIKNIFSDTEHGSQIYITLSESKVFDMQYINFEKFIKIEPSVQLKCEWINSKNISCNILNPERIISEKTYSIKIYDSEKSKNNLEKKPIFKKEIIIKNLQLFHASIQEWQNKNIPVIKIVFDDFVLEDDIIKKIKLIKKSNNKFFLLKKIENSEKYLDEIEKEENQRLFDKKFNNLSESEKGDFRKKYKRILFLKPISLLDEGTEFDLVFEEDEKELEIRNKQRNEIFKLLNVVFEEGDENSPQNQFRKKVFHFKTFAKKPKFLGIECVNYKYNILKLEIGKKYDFNDQNFKCKGRISLLFSSPLNDLDVFNHMNFSWNVGSDVDIKKFIEKNKIEYSSLKNTIGYSSFNMSNPYKVMIPSLAGGKKYSFSYQNKSKDSKFKEILKKSKNKKNEISDIFGDKFDDKFEFEFETANQNPHFFSDEFQNIFTFSKFDSGNQNIFYKTNNIKDYILQYNLLKPNFVKKNQIYEKNLENLEKNKEHQIQIFDKGIFENQSGILLGEISANPIENGFYESIKSKILVQNTSIDVIARKYKDNLTIIPFNLENNENIKNAEISLKEMDDSDFFDQNFQKMKNIFSGQTNDEGIFEIKNLNSIKDLDFLRKTYLVEVKKNSEIAWSFLKFGERSEFDEHFVLQIIFIKKKNLKI
jgi:hypothetical protein